MKKKTLALVALALTAGLSVAAPASASTGLRDCWYADGSWVDTKTKKDDCPAK